MPPRPQLSHGSTACPPCLHPGLPEVRVAVLCKRTEVIKTGQLRLSLCPRARALALGLAECLLRGKMLEQFTPLCMADQTPSLGLHSLCLAGSPHPMPVDCG